MSTLHALLVGVAKNQYSTNELAGCENDIEAMKACLNLLGSGYFTDIQMTQLLNEKATRAAVVQAFETHLIHRVKLGDVAVFYFSGHGGQEVAPRELQRSETDGKLEGLVCYDSSIQGVPKLIDKELRWLIYRLAEKGCEVITIFDCCHSGDNTRYEFPQEHTARHVKEGDDLVKRPWEELLVSETHPLRDLSILRGKELSDILPEGPHISFSACLDYEVAFESPTRKIGYFTQALTDVLSETRGSLSYLQLQREVHSRLRRSNFKQPQTPNVYTPFGNEDALLNNFLFGDRRDHPLYGNIVFNGKKWTIDLGGIHGLVEGIGENRTSIQVLTGKNSYELAYISQVYVDHSELVWECEEQEKERKQKFPETDPIDCYIALNQDAKYRGYISGLMAYPLKIFLSGEDRGVGILQQVMSEFSGNYPEFIMKLGDEGSTYYQVVATRGGYDLIQGSDQRSIVKRVEGYAEESAEQICRRLLAISRWTFIKDLHNKNNGWNEPFPIQLIFEEESGKTHFLTGKDKQLNLTHSAGGVIKFRIRCENQSEKELHISLLYLDQEFGIHTNFLRPNVPKLGNKHSEQNYASVDEGRWIIMRLPEHIKRLNWPEEIVFFKLIVSTQAFGVDIFAQDSLPAPSYDSPMRDSDTPKGFALSPRKELGMEWTTHLIECRIKNPLYEKGEVV